MKRFTLSMILLLLIIIGCANNKGDNPVAPGTGTTGTGGTTGDATGLVNEGYTALENQQITLANQKFEEALKIDPNNSKAQMGASVTGIGILFNDSEFQNTMREILKDDYNNFPHDADSILTGPKRPKTLTNPVLATKILKVAQKVTASQIQNVIERSILPIINKALERLNKLENSTNFTFVVSTKMSKGDKQVILDMGEVYALESVLYGLKAIFLELIAYNYDCNFNATGYYNPFSDSSYPNFGNLKDRQYMQDASISWINGCEKVIACVNFITNSDSDNATDGGINFGPQGWDSNPQEIINDVTEIKNCLQGSPINTDSNGISFQINLFNFFDSPIEDLDPYVNWDNLQYFLKDSNGYIYDFSDSYDFTLSGLFPDMTKAKFHQITEWPWFSLPGNNPPYVTITTPKTTVKVNETILLTANASDPDNDSIISYEWSCYYGTFNTKSGQQVSWTAPSFAANYISISVVVKDSRGGTASSYKYITVTY